MNGTTKGCVLAVALAVVASAASAQTPPAPTPQRSTDTYGNWVVRCEMRAGTPPQKACDMAQLFPSKGQTPSPLMQILIVRPQKKEPMRLVLQLQANVFIAPGAKFTYDDKQPPLTLPIVRCFPGACFATGSLADDLAKKLRLRTGAGRVEFKDGGERDVSVPVSFNGFGAAFDAWVRE